MWRKDDKIIIACGGMVASLAFKIQGSHTGKIMRRSAT
jgi:translation initiation factor 1 (eIF-1/SUI1)